MTFEISLEVWQVWALLVPAYILVGVCTTRLAIWFGGGVSGSDESVLIPLFVFLWPMVVLFLTLAAVSCVLRFLVEGRWWRK